MELVLPRATAPIQVNGVRKEYNGTAAIGDVSLTIDTGSIVSILGPSGCGKSTLLKIVAGLCMPSGGSVYFGGQPVTKPPFEMIYIFQQYNKSIFPWKTVAQNVAFGLRNRTRLSAREIAERCDEYIDLVGLGPYRNYYPAQLSGGMQQRVAIARALVCEPKVLLMDEPFGALDALTRNGLQDLLLQLWARLGLTVLFVTHDIEEAVYISQRVVVLGPPPSRVVADVAVDLPTPRDQITTRELPAYLRLRHRLYEVLTSFKTGGKAPC